MKLTVVVPIYKNNDAQQLRVSLDSLLRQTLLPNEILVVADGPVSAGLEREVERLKVKVQSSKLPIEVSYQKFEQNEGLGEAMRKAVFVAKGDYIARMDADDICLPNRFEKQMKCFEEDATLSVVGGQIAEFDGDVENITGRRVVPLEHEEIVSYMKSRNGMNHVTTILKKKDLVDSGNYQSFFLLEDYYLWVRMIQCGCRFKNVNEDVVLVRAGKEQMDRRGGLEYFKRQCEVFKYMLKTDYITLPRFLASIIERGIVHVLLPVSMRSHFYSVFLRK
ncbi:MAG: glycosyltransferase [Prevotella sp.]|nr:glycosyltransferase [Prevotella sp.]